MQTARGLAAITGASSGIGATFARTLAARGSDLILIARRQDRLEALATELAQSHGTKCEIVTADLSVDEDLERVAQRLQTATALTLLVNNAGFGAPGPFANVPFEGQGQMHRVHVMATLRLMHAALQGMVSRGAGAVINVSSVAGFLNMPGASSYGASKSWINAFTEVVWMELRGSGSTVRVQALCPGFTYSEFHDVMKMDRTKLAPKSWWCTSEQVVEDSLAGLEQDKIFVIPGWRYRLLVRSVLTMPKWLRRRVMLFASRRTGRMGRK